MCFLWCRNSIFIYDFDKLWASNDQFIISVATFSLDYHHWGTPSCTQTRYSCLRVAAPAFPAYTDPSGPSANYLSDNEIILPFFFHLWLYSPIKALAASMKLSVLLQLLDLGESVGLLGRVISSSQGLYLYTNTEKRTHNTNTKYLCPEWDSNSRSRRPRERRYFMLRYRDLHSTFN
jgi:hypothetical protein